MRNFSIIREALQDMRDMETAEENEQATITGSVTPTQALFALDEIEAELQRLQRKVAGLELWAKRIPLDAQHLLLNLTYQEATMIEPTQAETRTELPQNLGRAAAHRPHELVEWDANQLLPMA